jgi:hypothetical protein
MVGYSRPERKEEEKDFNAKVAKKKKERPQREPGSIIDPRTLPFTFAPFAPLR